MPNLTLIKNEILNDPASRGYSGKPAGAIAILMNEPLSQSPQVFSNVLVNPQRIVEVLIRRAKWKGLVDVVGSNTNAFSFVELMKLNTIPVDAQDASIVTLVTSLITAGLLSNADITALKPLYQQEVKLSRSEVIGVFPVSQGNVDAALA